MCLLTMFEKLLRIERLLELLIRKTTKLEKQMNVEFTELIREVEETKTVQASAVVALNGLVAKIDELTEELEEQGADTAKIIELRNALDASTNALAAAIPAGTE